MDSRPTWVQLLVRMLTRVLFRVRVQGVVADFGTSKTVVIANHQSFLDGVLLGAWLPRIPTFIVHPLVMKAWYFRIGMKHLPHAVVDSTNPMAMKTIVQLIERGEPVVIFPEGRITATGSLMKVYEGPAFLAAKTGARIVPVHIDNATRTYVSRMGSWYRKQLFPQITLTIHPPQQLTMPEGRTAKIRRKKAAEHMRVLMQEMIFASRRRLSIPDTFLETMRAEGRGVAVMQDIRGDAQSYGQILKAYLALGRLTAKRTTEGERVGVLMPNVGTTVSLLLGMMAMRRVPAMLNYTSGAEGMQSACEIAQIRTVLTSRKFLENGKLAEAVARLRGINLVYLEDLRPQFTLADKLWLMVYALWFPERATPRVHEDEPAVVLFTSGSEGKPKGVVLSHRAILANVGQVKAVIEFNNQDKVLNALPMFHSFGLTAGTLLPLLVGAKLLLYVSPLHYRVIPELAYDQDCTVLFGTGTFLLNYGKAANAYDFYRIRYVVAGAEKLSDEVRQLWMEKFGLRILEGYGATECAPVLAVNIPKAFRSGTVGPFLPGIEHRLLPVAGIEQGGALHVRGPNVMSGYLLHDRPGALQPPRSEVGEGWYNTGDIVEIDEDGFVKIVGRLKRFAKVAGEMVSLEVVEKLAVTASPAFGHAATTQADGNRGEVLVLFTEDPKLRREQLAEAARQGGYPELAVARRIEHVEKLPLLGSGKRDYVTLKAMAESLALPRART